VSDDDAFAVGLTCGGIMDVFVEKVSKQTYPELGQVAADIEAGRPVAVATVVEHPDPAWLGRRLVIHPEDAEEDEGDDTPPIDSAILPIDSATLPIDSAAVPIDSATLPIESAASGIGSAASGNTRAPAGSAAYAGMTLGSPRADAAVLDDARGMLAQGSTGLLTYGPDGERRGEGMRVFVASYAPRPRMLVFGAIDFAAAVAKVGSFLGYYVTVCDARPVFATKSRFPVADEVIVRWPHEYLREEVDAGRIDPRTVICVLTHDPKFDVPVLEIALRLPEVAYIGAMGSRRTHADRLDRLREAGLTEDELARMHSPVGLDLGARTPEETAISIAAEIILDRWGGRGQRLGGLAGPIHHHHGLVEEPPALPHQIGASHG
ncbi:XdhC/CoxI family protein, partial [Intrasporangium sp.]|uniref:XdhC/CoxI family protein n=1 Tax=Intrasporangium sp. TaxID=1925024 RepID=UPI00322171B9